MKAAFNKRFFDIKTARYDNGTQTSSLLPLSYGLAPPAELLGVHEARLPVVPAVAFLAGDGENACRKAELLKNGKTQSENFLITVIERDGKKSPPHPVAAAATPSPRAGARGDYARLTVGGRDCRISVNGSRYRTFAGAARA